MKPSTSLPWRLFSPDNASNVAGCSIRAAHHRRVAKLRDYVGDQTGSCKANAAYIVHAANAYPKLVNALAEFAEILDGNPEAETPLQRAAHKAIALLIVLGEYE